MPIQSPMSNLRDILAQVKDAAKKYSTTLKTNEDATRAALIDPVLHALGWDTAQAKMVEVEKTAKGARADYALFDGSGVQVIVEAKKLGDPLQQHALGLINDAFAFQVSSVFLTDGLIWQHYTSFAPQGFRPFKEFDISQNDLGEIAAYLIQALDAARFWPQEEDTTAPEILRLQQDYAALQQGYAALEKRVTILEGGKQPPPPLPYWVDLDKLPTDMTRTVPSMLRLPDGTEISVKSWRQTLFTACEAALVNNPAIPLPFSDYAKGSTNLLNTVQVNLSAPLTTSNGGTVFVYLNYSSKSCIDNIKYILTQFSPAGQKAKPAVVYTRN